MRKSLLVSVLLGHLAAGAALAAEPPAVLVSIKPLHGLVAAVMQGVAEPGLIVGGGNSPHGYALKPSDMRALEKADLVVWVGKDFETWLERPLTKTQAKLTMRDIPGMAILPTREGGIWESHDHDHGKPGDHDEVDGHLWLAPANAARLVEAVAVRLAGLDAAHAAAYHANAAAARARIAAMDAALSRRLAPLAGRPYVVFHDAHQYFEKQYGLSPAGAMTVDPERPLGAKRLAALRDRLKTAKAACVFREPRFGGTAAQTLADSAGVRLGQLDPEGTLVPAGPESYFVLMENLGSGLADCLSAR